MAGDGRSAVACRGRAGTVEAAQRGRLALAQIRFYMSMRWNKNDELRSMVLKVYGGGPQILWRWLTGDGPNTRI